MGVWGAAAAAAVWVCVMAWEEASCCHQRLTDREGPCNTPAAAAGDMREAAAQQRLLQGMALECRQLAKALAATAPHAGSATVAQQQQHLQ